MIVIPAYGATVGGWFGAWPMPLDWERPWQVIYLYLEPYIQEIGSLYLVMVVEQLIIILSLFFLNRSGLYVCVMEL